MTTARTGEQQSASPRSFRKRVRSEDVVDPRGEPRQYPSLGTTWIADVADTRLATFTNTNNFGTFSHSFESDRFEQTSRRVVNVKSISVCEGHVNALSTHVQGVAPGEEVTGVSTAVFKLFDVRCCDRLAH